METFGTYLRQSLADRHKEQVEIARALKIKPTTVWRWCSDRSRPSRPHLKWLIDELSLDPVLAMRLCMEPLG